MISWRLRRRFLYGGVAAAVVVVVGAFFIWKIFFSTPPSCFDGKQDGAEQGIDCGGPCALLCSDTARAPVVLWARAFPSSPSTYTAAAEIENDNAGAGARAVHYSFQLFDSDNSLVVERDGAMDLPPVQTIPIIEPNISVGNRTVAHTVFAFSELPVWYSVPAGSVPALSVSDQNLSPDGSRLSATVTNNSITQSGAFVVEAVLYDASGAALAASKSTVPGLASLSSTQVTFTWELTSGVVRAELTILPPF